MSGRDPFVEVAAGSAVFREGEPGSEMYIIESGQVDILRMDRGSEPVATLDAGDFFGEMAILEDQPRFATAIAKSPCRLLRIDRASFPDVMRSNVEIPIRIMRKLAGRLRRAEQRAEDAHGALDEFRRRIASRDAAAKLDAPPPAVEPPSVKAAAAAPPARVAPASAAPRAWVLKHPSGAAFALEGQEEFLVGRPDPVTGINPEINLGPYDVARSLSRRHAKVVVKEGRAFVREDVGTTNGTFVNGTRLTTGVAVELSPGDRIKFGSVEVGLETA